VVSITVGFARIQRRALDAKANTRANKYMKIKGRGGSTDKRRGTGGAGKRRVRAAGMRSEVKAKSERQRRGQKSQKKSEQGQS
jgi:hypothetical protein